MSSADRRRLGSCASPRRPLSGPPGTTPALPPGFERRAVDRPAHALQRRPWPPIKLLQDYPPIQDALHMIAAALALAPGHLPIAQPEIKLALLGHGWRGRYLCT